MKVKIIFQYSHEQPKQLKKNLKNSSITVNRALIVAMTRHNALSIKPIRPLTDMNHEL